MKTMYDADIDYLEVIEEGFVTVGKHVSDSLTLFYADSGRMLVGFALEGATQNLSELSAVPVKLRLSAVFRIVRGVLSLSQKEFAALIDVGERTLQRIEAGESNPTFQNVLTIADVAPEELDVSVLLAKQHR